MSMSDDQQVEKQIQAKGLTAPRVTPDSLDAKIIGEDYHVFPGTTVTVCLLHLENGFTVTGESACASPENFDAELGREIARRNAREKIWMLEGYLLRDRLHRGETTAPAGKARKEGKPSADQLAVTDGSGLAFYQSHKQVHARPMTRGDYNAYRGWQIPADENPEDPGYLVVYNRGTEDHYESWSPKHVFDDGYTEIAY